MSEPRKITGIDSAIIAVMRYRAIPAKDRFILNNNGVYESEALTILSLEAMLFPERVTDEEMAKLAEAKAKLEAMKDG